ncbi:MAG: sensor histidine kinase [Pseudomonadota bacterium]
MNKARSIKQNTLPDALPNFRNLGVTLRILLICNGLALLEAVLLANVWSEVPQRMMQIAALLTPILLTTLLLLWVTQPWLYRISYARGVLAVNGFVVLLTLAIYYSGGELYRQPAYDGGYFVAVRYVLLSVAVCATLLMYFRWRSQVLSRALEDARLQVLRARIRPHFLFNTINAVLGIVRANPKLAETALEDMGDLFRTAMSEAQDLVLLSREVELSRQYLALEQLRMGDRLRVDWDIDNIPDDAKVPPLLLQPLLENAVYHGIEPLSQGGCIRISLHRHGGNLRIKVVNPYVAVHRPHRSGNKMALQNIRERLELLFDVEANYQVEQGKDFYQVEITLPYLKERSI